MIGNVNNLYFHRNNKGIANTNSDLHILVELTNYAIKQLRFELNTEKYNNNNCNVYLIKFPFLDNVFPQLELKHGRQNITRKFSILFHLNNKFFEKIKSNKIVLLYFQHNKNDKSST